MAKIKAPAMVYVKGEEMTRYAMQLIMESWIEPNLDISDWQFFDLSCVSRDDTKDKVLYDLIEAGKEVRSIFKEPTITPTEEQKQKFGLSKAWGSPNGIMRRGWNGVTISRDTIHIDGVDLGYKNPVYFDRHAVGGEYGGGHAILPQGRLETKFYPQDGSQPIEVDSRELKDSKNAAVTYHNPLDNVEKMAHHFFSRAFEANVTPYVVTKKTVFKWQEEFWSIMKKVFDEHYKEKFNNHNLLDRGELTHVISDAACMKLVAWKDGGYAMASHNYDGDMLTDLMSQVHRSPGFISSCLVGINDDGTKIKEFEASHGTVSDMYYRMKQGIETSLNPVGMVFALKEAIKFSSEISNQYSNDKAAHKEANEFADIMYSSMCQVISSGRGTRDIFGKEGSTTEQFVELVSQEISKSL